MTTNAVKGIGEKLLNVAIAVLTVCAVAVTSIRVIDWVKRPADPLEPRSISNAATFAGSRHVLGNPAAKVRIIEFSDFQCPYCRKAAVDLKDLVARYPELVVLEYRHFPISGHQFAVASAAAAECAGDQGRFFEYHDQLFANADSIGKTSFAAFAVRAGVADTGRFGQCLADSATVARVEVDRILGTRLPVDGTPTLIINDQVIGGFPGKKRLEELVKAAQNQ